MCFFNYQLSLECLKSYKNNVIQTYNKYIYIYIFDDEYCLIKDDFMVYE
jgi:hypothetical protein